MKFKLLLTFIFLLPILCLSNNIRTEDKIMTFPASNISISINRPKDVVYAYISDPLNLPKWASGLANSKLVQAGEEWIANSPMGKVRVKFAPKNSFGIVDHDVTLPTGEVNHNPLRVAKNMSGSEVIFTLYKRPNVKVDEFEKDYQTIKQDLTKLKELLEQ